MYQQTLATIVDHRLVAPGYQRMVLTGEADYSTARPGQFVMLGIGSDQLLLRRPFSIHRLTVGRNDQAEIAILYKIVGAGTAALARLTPGAQLDVLGPLGQGFRVRDAYHRIFIAAGGIGVAPMVYLLAYLARTHDLAACEVFLGGRTREDLLCVEDFRRLGATVHRTTDDGSDGAQCFLTHPLEIEAQERPPDVIYACGPIDMLSCVAGIAERLKVPCQVSIESAMACGVGACLGCAVRPRSGEGYLHVCKDGPVFDAEQMRW
jgi:dihydroorotate dehydrogenase electron transfer subunit